MTDIDYLTRYRILNYLEWSMCMNMVEQYWQTMYMHDTLKYRLCDIDDPTWSDVKDMIARMGPQIYYLFDQARYQIVAEFTLENFTGRAAQIHFSAHPENETKTSLALAEKTADRILNSWARSGKPKEPYLETLFGLTPLTNRVACIFVLKSGFKKIGVLPKGIKDRGQYVDAMISIKERDNGRIR